MQNKSSKFHHFTMHNLSARVGFIVSFQDILESQINMAKVYFHGEMTMLKRYVPNSMYVAYTMLCSFKYRRLLTGQYW